MGNTNLLCSEMGFLRGFASVMDLGGTLYTYNTSPSEAIADRRALTSDWQTVGNDLRKAMAGYGE